MPCGPRRLRVCGRATGRHDLPGGAGPEGARGSRTNGRRTQGVWAFPCPPFGAHCPLKRRESHREGPRRKAEAPIGFSSCCVSACLRRPYPRRGIFLVLIQTRAEGEAEGPRSSPAGDGGRESAPMHRTSAFPRENEPINVPEAVPDLVAWTPCWRPDGPVGGTATEDAMLRVEMLSDVLDQRLEDPEAVLEVLVNALAKGQAHRELWEKAHAGATRDGRLAEFAAAYERVTADKRIKLLSPLARAELFLHAARFSEVLGDATGSILYAEKALSSVPGNAEAFELLERLLAARQESIKLARLYLDIASSERDREQHLAVLRRAAQVLSSAEGAEELSIEVSQRILRLDPSDSGAIEALERHFVATGRHRDAARILEQALSKSDNDPGQSLLLRAKLLDLYGGELGEPQRAIGHAEAILEADPAHERALSVAEALLEHRVVAPRAAAALSDAYQKAGRAESAASMLSRELKLARGPRRLLVQKRLAILRQDVLADPAGALDLLAPVVAGDPSDDELRRRYIELSLALEQPLEAAKRLSKAVQSIREAPVRARITVEVGKVYLASGDVKQALVTFQRVVEANEDAASVLAAARQLVELYAEAGEQKKLASMLELVVRMDPEEPGREAAARRLARLCDEMGDRQRSVIAYQALMDSDRADEALARLQVLYEEVADHGALVDVLERRAARATSAPEARRLALRAAELRTTLLRDRAAAIAAWESFLERHGPAREVHARLIPLLEQEKRWDRVRDVLLSEVELAPTEERASLLAKLGQLRLTRLGDGPGALAAFAQALTHDPQERTSRVAIERFLSVEDLRLQAARVLEPIYRAEQAAADWVRVLEVLGSLEPSARDRLRMLTTAVEVTESLLRDLERAAVLAGRALGEAIADRGPTVRAWLERVARLATVTGNPAAPAQVLLQALGNHPIDSDDVFEVARTAAEALVVSGDVAAAIEVYRRALAYQPASAELVQRLDELLVNQGSPKERLALYEAALAQPSDATRRRELLHAMATVQSRELSDVESAIATWQLAIADDPRDPLAHRGLVEAYSATGNHAALHQELGRALAFLEGERRHAMLKRLAESEEEQGVVSQALGHYRELLAQAELTDQDLSHIQQLASSQKDATTERDALVKRLSRATEPDAQAELLMRLGQVQAEGLADPKAAVESWLAGARLSEGAAADERRALLLYEQVLTAAPTQVEAANRLIELYARLGAWAKVPAAYRVLLEGQGDGLELVAKLNGLEAQALAAGEVEVFVQLIDATLQLPGLHPDKATQLLLTKAIALGGDPRHEDEVARIFRAVLTGDTAETTEAEEAFEAFLNRAPATAARVEDRRWLFDWRARHAADPTVVWLTWAAAEESSFGNPQGAIELLLRVLEQDPTRTDALAELARLQTAGGDPEAALGTLRRLREHAQGDEALLVDHRIAWLLFEALGRPGEALGVAAGLLDLAPADPDALQIAHRSLRHPELRVRAAELLERAAEASADQAAQARVLEALLALPADGPDVTQARLRWLDRLLECRRDDPEAALGIALRGAKEHPEAEALWATAERLARRLDRPVPVADAYAELLNADLGPDLAETLGRRMVEFHEEWFEEPDRVIGLLRRVLALSPGAGWAFDRLKLAFNAAGRWDDLFDLYDQGLCDLDSPSRRTELLREAAMAAKDFASDPNRAIFYLEQLNALRPKDTSVENSLERLYERTARKRELIELLGRRLLGLSEAEKIPLKLRMVTLWLDLGEPVPPFEVLTGLKEQDPVPPDVFELLRRLIELPEAVGATLPWTASVNGRKPSVRDLGASILREYFASQGQMAEVAYFMEVGLESAGSDAELISRLEEIVQLRTRVLNDPEGAFRNVARLVRIQPDLSERRELLAALAATVGAQGERAALLAEIAAGVPVLALRALLLTEAAMVYSGELGDTASAIGLQFQVLQAGAEDRPIALAAARELDSLLREGDQPEEHCRVLEIRAQLEDDPEARRQALATAALVAAERLGDLDRAISAWRRRLEDDPLDLAALDGLCEVLSRTERVEDLVAALRARADVAQTPAAIRQDLVRVARLQLDRRQDRSAAIAAWQEVRKRCGRDLESYDALVPLLRTEERWRDLATLLTEEAAAEGASARRRALYQTLGVLYREQLQDLSWALRSFVSAGDWAEAIATAATETTPRDMTFAIVRELLEFAVEDWTRRTESAEEPPSAAAAAWAIEELGERLRSAGQHAEVVGLLLRGAELPFNQQKRREFRREAACVCSDQLQDGDRAIEIFRGLFSEDPGDAVAASSVTRLALLLEERGLHGEIAELWEQQARARQAAGSRAGAAALWTRAAELWEGKLRDLDHAVMDLRHAAGLGGEQALEALARIHEARGEPRLVAEALEWLCAQSSREALAGRALRLAEAYVAANERGFARARLEQAAATALDAGPVRRRLAELYREDEDWGPLADLLTKEAARAPGPESKLALLREAASLHLQKRGSPSEAIPLLESAIDLEPDDASLRLDLSQAFERAGRLDEALALLRNQIERYGSRRPKGRALVHLQLARVSLLAGLRADAMAELELANKIDPAHPDILQGLARLAFEEGELERAEQMYRALLLVLGTGVPSGGPSRGEALLDLSAIARQKGDLLRAEEFLETAFEAALGSDREGERLEAALRERGQKRHLARMVLARAEQSREPETAARVLGELVSLMASGDVEQPPSPETLRAWGETARQGLERSGIGSDRAWGALGKVYEWLGDTALGLRVLEQRVASYADLESEAAVEAASRLAEVRLGTDETLDAGLDLVERMLNLPFVGTQAEHLIRSALARRPGHPRAVNLLERLGRARKDRRLVADALGLRLEREDVGPDVVREAVDLAKELADQELSVRSLRRALELELPDEAAAWVRRELADHLERSGDLAGALELRVQATEYMDAARGRALLLEVARSAVEKRQDLEYAAEIYRRLVESDPADRQAWEPLLDLYRAQRDQARLVALIDQTVPRVETLQDRARLRLEQAQILLERGEDDEAADILRDLLQEDPAQARVARLLAGLLEKTGRNDELILLLEQQLDAAKSRDDREAVVSLSMRIGGLQELEGRADDAFETYRGIHAWDPRCRLALEAVVRLSEKRDDPHQVADAIEDLLVIAEEGEAAKLAARLVKLRVQQGDARAAERALELGFGVSPRNSGLREALIGRYEKRGEWTRVAEVLQRAVDACPKDPDLLGRLVDAHRSAGQPGQALQVLESVVAADPDNAAHRRRRAALLLDLGHAEEALTDLEQAHAQGGECLEELIDALRRTAGGASRAAARAARLRLVEVLSTNERADEAREELVQLAKTDPSDRAVLRRLVEVELEAERWPEASDALRQLLPLEQGEDLISSALKLADACERAGRLADAQPGLEQAMAVAPENAELRARLRRLYEATDNKRDLARVLEGDAKEAPDQPARVGLLHRAGALWLEAEQPEEAIRVLGEARLLEPDDVQGVLLLSRALTSVHRQEEAVRLLQDTVAGYRGKRDKALSPLYQELAHLHLEDGMLSDALQLLQKALDLDKRNGRLAMQLGELALEAEEFESAHRAFRAVTMMREYSPSSGDGASRESKANAHYYLAWMAHRSGDERRARMLATKALAENSEHEQARALLDGLGQGPLG